MACGDWSVVCEESVDGGDVSLVSVDCSWVACSCVSTAVTSLGDALPVTDWRPECNGFGSTECGCVIIGSVVTIESTPLADNPMSEPSSDDVTQSRCSSPCVICDVRWWLMGVKRELWLCWIELGGAWVKLNDWKEGCSSFVAAKNIKSRDAAF